MKRLVSAPYLVWMTVFIVVPLLMVAYFAVTNVGGGFTWQYILEVGQYSIVFIKSIAS